MGHVRNGGIALTCVDCERWFHAKCERLDMTAHELQQMASKKRYVCKECEEVRLKDAGYDLSKGRFLWQCKYCPKMFDDEADATHHGKRCASAESRREWSCPCNGQVHGALTTMLRCESCKCYFHKKCKDRARAAWDTEKTRDEMCLRCEKAGKSGGSKDGGEASLLNAESHSTSTVRSGRASALSDAAISAGSDAEAAEQQQQQQQQEQAMNGAGGANGGGGGGGGGMRNSGRKRQFNELEQQNKTLAALLPLEPEEIGGTLADGRVVVMPSGLGPGAGLGLYAGRAFKSGDVITSYSGPIIDRSQIEAADSWDTSYVLRIPNSGGQLIDGKPFADAIRSNKNNPGAFGRWYPPGDKEDGAPEWHEGAASMANDPRDARLYNSRLEFKRRQGANKALCELAPMRAILYATRDLRAGEEIYYNYGSDKPFEKMRKEMQKKKAELQRRERDVCRSVWVPYEAGEGPAGSKGEGGGAPGGAAAGGPQKKMAKSE